MTLSHRFRIARAVLAAATIALSLRAFGADAQSEQVTVAGAVSTPLTLKVDDLKAFPAEQIINVALTRHEGDKDLASNVRGVKLTAVLDRAGVSFADKNAWKHTAVMASATDGYQVVFSWPELVNTDVGPGVIVIFERDGEALGAREGRIALVSARDLRTGPRTVKWLTRIDVKMLKD